MAKFNYTAVDQSNGKVIKGAIDADSQESALARLHDQKLHVVDINIGGEKRRISSLSIGSKRVKLEDLVVYTRQFATMINAGLSIVRCLDILQSQTKSNILREVTITASKDVRSGMSLTDAFAKHPNVFSKLYISMLRAAELGGIMDEIMNRIAGFLESDMEIRTKIKSALMYPAIVLCFSIVVLIAMFTLVLPKFKEIFTGMNIEMPGYTKALFTVSDALMHYWYIPVGAIVAIIVFYRYWNSTSSGRYQIDYFKLKIPVVGEIIQKMSIARFSRTFATLVGSGVPMMRALEIVGETSGNAVISNAVLKARESVREGQRISAPLAATGFFPSMVTQMIDVGEETGRLSEMLAKIADFYDKEVDAAVKGLTSIIEPMLIVFMGVIVGFIAISILGPIFKLAGSIR